MEDKEPLKKAKTPQGRLDGPEEASQSALKSENCLFLFSHKPNPFAKLIAKGREIAWSPYHFQAKQFSCHPAEFPDDVNPETKEKGGPRGPEPTRYGDWERKGRCVDF